MSEGQWTVAIMITVILTVDLWGETSGQQIQASIIKVLIAIVILEWLAYDHSAIAIGLTTILLVGSMVNHPQQVSGFISFVTQSKG